LKRNSATRTARGVGGLHVERRVADHVHLGGGRAVQHRLERLGAHVRIGHPSVGELADVGGDPVQLLECAPPRDRARPARADQLAIDVEEQDPARVGHGISAVLRPSQSVWQRKNRASPHSSWPTR
jgi:hypothetical protein